MSVNNKQLREGIIAKLKDYEAYVDNELPDYIMVMLANNKTVLQINNDLQLFLGDNTDRFTSWLQRAITDPSALMEKETETIPERRESVTVAGTKRKRESTPLLDELEDYQEEEEEREAVSPPKVATATPVQREEEGERREREEEVRAEEEGSSPTKVIKLSGGEESRSRSQRSNIMAKKIIKVLQPDSTRDQDLRELIAQRRKEKSHHHHHHHDHDRQREVGNDGEVEDEYNEDQGGGAPTSLSSVVKLVHTERPHRTDKGGSRLLHKAILGIKSGGKRSSKSREGATTSSGSSGRGKTSEPSTRIKGSSSSKHTTATTDQGHSDVMIDGGDASEAGEGREGSVGVEEVLVEVEEEGAMVDEFRQEQQLEKTKRKQFRDAIEKSTIAAVQKVLPLGGRLRLTDVKTSMSSRVQRLLGAAGRSRGRSERRDRDREGESEEEVDLREVLNKKKEKTSESSTRFVVTLTGAGDEFTRDSPSDLDQEEEREGEEERETEKKVVGVSLSRHRRFNSQAVEAAKIEREEVPEQDVEEDYEEDHTGGRGLGGHPERCRFWPNCKNGDSCPYHHPSVPCRLFPNCKYGNKCHFIHPRCKFDARCTRADCPYLHTAPRHLSSGPAVAPPTAPIITSPIFSPFTSGFSFGRPSPWQQSRPQRYPNKSALSWTPGVKGGHVSDRQFAVSEDQTTALPV